MTNHHYILSSHKDLFYLNQRYTDTTYSPGDSLCFHARIVPFKHNSNPGEFSYAQYLKHKQVYYQLIPESPIIKTGQSHDLFSFFYSLREKIIRKTNQFTQDSICKTLINALCLGYKLDLEDDFRDLFITTGTIHLLSVSGLHTGALYLFFLFIFKYIGISKRKAELLLLPILWSYACLTGLAPSVVRASTILSFIAIGKVFNRTYTPLNALSASAFFTLLIQPSALYSMSFLLSYSAYSGILIFYPMLFKLPGTLPPIWSNIYACFCLTISAQLPTLPLSAYYFHTININGFLANLVAVPLTTALLYCAASCLIIPLFVSQHFHFICEFLSHLLIDYLTFFAPYSIHLHALYPSTTLAILLYICMFCGGDYLFYRKKSALRASIISWSILLLYLICNNIQLQANKEILVCHYYKKSVILLNYKGFCFPLKNTSTINLSQMPYVKQHKLKTLDSFSGFIGKELYYKKNILIHHTDTLQILSSANADLRSCQTLIIQDNTLPPLIWPNVSLPQLIILDGSNHRKTIHAWKSFCQKYDISLWNTSEQGYVQLQLQ